MFPGRTAAATMLVGALAVWSAVAGAQQQIYRIVGPDGRITFSDRPPAEGNAQPAKVLSIAGNGGTSTASLPFELRTATERYPVTLYTGVNCTPCGTARSFLTQRGIPFAEKTVTSNEDIEALKRMSGANTLPFATIGGQQLKGFSESEWTQFLDAAGYPKTSQLPPNYRYPQTSPLVVAQEKQPQRPAEEARAPAPATAPPTAAPPANPDNPAGIRF